MSEKINVELAKELTKEITQKLFYFSKEILGYKQLQEEVHFKLCEFLNDRYVEEDDGEVKTNKLILMPRGTFKTTIASVAFVIQQVILNPDIRILIASESFTNAKNYLGLIKKHFEGNEKLRTLYGDYVSKFGWREDSIFVSKRKKHKKEPTIQCSGIEVTRTGMHYDLIVCDDLVSPNNITTKEQMDKVVNFYRECTNLIERTGKKGKIVVIGTRWHFSDLYSYIQENEEENFNILVRSAYNKDGSLFFPQVLTEDELNRQRRSLGSYLFACNYLNNPVDNENAVFKKDWIKYYKPNELGNKYPNVSEMNTYLHIDPAISEKKGGDFSGLVITGVDTEENVYVLHASKEKINVFNLIRRIFELYKKYAPEKVLLETQVFQKSIKFFLYDEMKKRKTYLPIEEIQHSWQKSKEMRISGLQPKFEFGGVFIRSDMKDLEDELLRFPVGKHDDMIDALSFGLGYWRRASGMKKPKAPRGSFEWVRKKIIGANADLKYIGNQKLDKWRQNYGSY